MRGRAILAVNDSESGGRFVELFAKAFGGTLPTPTSTPQAPKPLFINTAVLAENYHRDTGGGFSGDGGGWTASKWFVSNDLAEAEVYFNFTVLLGQLGFSEKDDE